MIVADASWIIALRDPEDAHHTRASAIGIATVDDTILLHPLTLAECLVGPAKLGQLEDAERALRAADEVVDLDDGAPRRWAELRATTGLRLPDAIVLDTALRHQATAVVTFDDRPATAAADRGFEVPGSDDRSGPSA